MIDSLAVRGRVFTIDASKIVGALVAVSELVHADDLDINPLLIEGVLPNHLGLGWTLALDRQGLQGKVGGRADQYYHNNR